MPTMTQNERSARKKIRISIIDIIIILTVIACILGMIFHYKMYENDNAVVTSYTCHVSVMFEGVPHEIGKNITVGDKIYLDSQKEAFGVISSIEEADHNIYYTNAKNEIVTGVDTTKKNIVVVIDVKGDVRTDGFYANGIEYIGAGMKMQFSTPDFSGNGLIFDVQQQSE